VAPGVTVPPSGVGAGADAPGVTSPLVDELANLCRVVAAVATLVIALEKLRKKES
jgi:hypothetical protein